MEFKPHLFKSWFTLAETQQLLKNNYKFEYSKKEIIATLSKYPKSALLYFDAEYNDEINQLTVTGKKQKFAKMEFIINPDFDIQNAPIIFRNALDKILKSPRSILTSRESEIIITAIQEKPFIHYFKGLLHIPEICFDDVIFNLSTDEELILPETEFYNPINKKYSLELEDEEKEKIRKERKLFNSLIGEQENLYENGLITIQEYDAKVHEIYNKHYTIYEDLEIYSNFIFIRFNPAALGSIILDKVQIFAHDFSYIANLFEYENEQRATNETEENEKLTEQSDTLQPPKTEKTVKNKSNPPPQNPTLRSKKEFFTPMILASMHATAKAYPHLGGYQIINAIIARLIDERGFRTPDFYTPEAYLKKFKKIYDHPFPRNSGRNKAQFTAIIVESDD
ncbi:hypothetical protein [Rodentibacter caecimuris]|uniref:hypothetical protein n=1 Tax=Rodentibacter caecimuris TaxID=1796644 RepID=UPI0013A09A42|nr:hypothetical protein [Rodentibacter heylii]QIA76056.1 hypothetical protein FEE42_01120 [Rodentibacter heylii]